LANNYHKIEGIEASLELRYHAAGCAGRNTTSGRSAKNLIVSLKQSRSLPPNVESLPPKGHRSIRARHHFIPKGERLRQRHSNSEHVIQIW
jgi:hypothetical protein